LSSAGLSVNIINSFLESDHTYCEEYLKLLGAETVESMDVSNYENATIIHNMNITIPGHLIEQYDTVVDGGSLEHIFNFPIAIKNCMQMIKLNGFYIAITPANNFFGHGFYQFSPELYFRIFTEENGFSLKSVILYSGDRKGFLYDIKDPKTVSNRITLINSKPLLLFIIAKKINNVVPFSTFPNQSDYNDTVWKKESLSYTEVFQVKGILSSLKKIIPYSLKSSLLKFRNRLKTIFCDAGDLRSIHYKKINKS
jgi:hypothetical protein